MPIPARTVSLAKGGDDAFRFWDPAGSAHNATQKASTVTPVTTLVSPQDQLPPLNSPVLIEFTSTQPGAWEIASGPDDAVIVPNIDGMSATISFVPSLVQAPKTKYISARCRNKGGTSIATCRVHPGMRGVLKVGVGEGWDYADVRAAIAAMGGLGGYAIVIQNQTVAAANDAMHFYRSGTTSYQPNLPVSGDHTVNSVGTDPIYTITRFTSLVAESPFGVIYDGENVRGRGFDLWGGTALEYYERTEVGWSNVGCVSAINLRGIHLLGFVAKQYTSECIHLYHVDHMHVEHCIGFDGSNDSQPIRSANSTDILFEYCWAFGKGRYKIGHYQCKRTRTSRSFAREEQITAGSPRGRYVHYHMDGYLAQNLIEFDCDQEDFWTQLSWQDSGMLTIAHTSYYGYGKDYLHQGILSFNSKLGMLLNDQRGIPNEDSYVFEDMTAWRMRPIGAGAIGQNGPCRFKRVTAAYIDNSASGYASFIWEPNKHIVEDGIIYKYGYTSAGAPTGTGYLIYSYSGDQPIEYKNFTLFDVAAGVTERQGIDTANSITFTNVDRLTDPTTQGMRYPGRIEPGSPYAAIGRGADGFYHANGRNGTFYGETGCLEKVQVNWMSRSLFELALPFLRAYSYTGPKKSGGTGTLTGDRGGAQSSKMLLDYVRSDQGRDVPFPASVQLTKNGGVLQVSWQLFASAYQGTITGWKINIDGSFAQLCAANTHAALFAGLYSGRTYTGELVAIDAVYGDSGPSYKFSVVM